MFMLSEKYKIPEKYEKKGDHSYHDYENYKNTSAGYVGRCDKQKFINWEIIKFQSKPKT